MIVRIVSFGFGHGEPPQGHLVVDLREHFRDPHVSPRLRHLTARDDEVQAVVWETPGIEHLVHGLVGVVAAYALAPSGEVLTIAVGCSGGRHRAPVVAQELAAELQFGVAGCEIELELAHRDLAKPVIAR